MKIIFGNYILIKRLKIKEKVKIFEIVEVKDILYRYVIL